ncbi:MBL fold metallo-hydrolase [Pseudoduganella umbonata]|uniref:Beta-lactamase superfamily II metal-dependent hydrolase n=1 Tax=Pseudoduganella umbonata TaxID=864828 RepID=A0A4P8HMR7_9BURK|nr:MBL fold metallo-hydrolase [Pseudoduganella umbonata]MBB3219566.1 beta-lactamase superfamily II metal-dependent hydrolase [Pseudoduganella umbonata]QCP09638.1 MBL fold metallo-hydrolase [Pseudoduganella umbonata]
MATRRSAIFSLEALDAAEGDALILHYGGSAAPRHLLIDGGPRGTWRRTLGPRLAQIAERLGQRPLELRHILVTHLDGDHIGGVLALAESLGAEDCPVQCDRFWLNTFDGALLAHLPAPARAAMAALDDQAPAASGDGAHPTGLEAARASVRQGQGLLEQLERLQAVVNGGATSLVADGGPATLPLDPAMLDVQLVCPNIAHLRKLSIEWERKGVKDTAATADYVDTSVFNLSSLVIVVTARGADGRKASMLLTGDARGDHVLAGLEDAGLLDADGRVYFDVLKVPHHGSDRNLEADFFRRVQARHYVISADGRHDNPSTDTLVWIAAGARKRGWRVWLTNRTNPLRPALAANIAAALKAAPKLKTHLRTRESGAPGVMVDLMARVEY